ncbi:MAG: hypothetical protein K2N51_00300 [Lachnospiraceae bacterium]|nr:hypothetical protein [Lachnospiraceae bacterium]
MQTRRKSVTVHTYGANSNGIQPIYNSPLAKGWILGYSTFLAHSLTASVKLVSEQ